MAKTEIVLLAVLALAAFTLYNIEESNGEGKALFAAWKVRNGKNYALIEEDYRMGIWMKNWAYVKEHNQKYKAGAETFNLEMNHFADLTSEEFGATYLMSFPKVSDTNKCTGSQAPTNGLPDSIDWSTQGAVTPIKNQGQCGSCWAFSTIGSMEGVHFQTEGKLESFSEQQLVDCSHAYGNKGCQGGLMNMAFWYIKDHGITTESKYPYRGVGSTCKYNAETDKVWGISDCTEVTVDKELALRASVAQNPVSVAIQANHLSFQLYKSGVYSGNCGTKLDHGVLAVGYGEQNGKKYWKVKNSWGPSWGQSGYIFIENTGDGKGKCGIQ